MVQQFPLFMTEMLLLFKTTRALANIYDTKLALSMGKADSNVQSSQSVPLILAVESSRKLEFPYCYVRARGCEVWIMGQFIGYSGNKSSV